RELILGAAPHDFFLIYAFSIKTGVRIADLMYAKIESITLKGKGLVLRKLGTLERQVGLFNVSDEAVEILQQAIAGRKSGLIFRRRDQSAWNLGAISQVFRRLRRKLKLPEEIVLSGRGGRVGKSLQGYPMK